MVCKCKHTKEAHKEHGCVMPNGFGGFCRCDQYDASRIIAMVEPNAVAFTLLSMPVSVNGIYQILFNERRVELKPEARRWKSTAKESMPPWKLQSKTSLICLDVVFFYDFYDSTGKLLEKDTHNYMKLLQDAVAERYGFKDSRVKRCPIDSRHAKQESVRVIVSEYNLE